MSITHNYIINMIVKNMLFKTIGAQSGVSTLNSMMMFNPGAMRFFAAAAA